MTLTEQEIEEIQGLAEQDIKKRKEEDSESEDFKEIEAAAFKQKKLKKDLAKKNKELRDKLGLGTTKSKKGVQFGDLPKNKKAQRNPDKRKGRSKEAGRDQSTKDRDDLGDDSSSSSESSSGKKSGTSAKKIEHCKAAASFAKQPSRCMLFLRCQYSSCFACIPNSLSP